MKKINSFTDRSFLYYLNDDLYKITSLTCRNDNNDINDFALAKIHKAKNNYNFRLDNSISRSRSAIFEIVMCNDFKYWCTFTINGDKFPRDDLKGYFDKFTHFLRYQRKKYNIDIQYLFIPELHSDKINWHLHGFLSAVPDVELLPFSCHPNIDNLPLYIKSRRNCLYSYVSYEKTFGFCCLEEIYNKTACARYASKYVTKGFEEISISHNKGDKLYYCSRGLNRKVLLEKGYPKTEKPLKIDYRSDYATLGYYNSKDLLSLGLEFI